MVDVYNYIIRVVNILTFIYFMQKIVTLHSRHVVARTQAYMVRFLHFFTNLGKRKLYEKDFIVDIYRRETRTRNPYPTKGERRIIFALDSRTEQ